MFIIFSVWDKGILVLRCIRVYLSTGEVDTQTAGGDATVLSHTI